jgi:hypothetical protein
MSDNVAEQPEEMVELPVEEEVAAPAVEEEAEEQLEELDPDMRDAYDIVYAQVEDILADGMVGEDNVAWIIKAVMEAVDAVAVFAEWPGPVKAAKGKLLAKHVINDLHKKGKVNDDVYRKLMSALNILSLAMFTLSVLGDKGKILFQHVKNGVQRACVRCKNRNNEKLIQERHIRRGRAALKHQAKEMHKAHDAPRDPTNCCDCCKVCGCTPTCDCNEKKD